jgi:Ala-tRNA(Pro) deacylase
MRQGEAMSPATQQDLFARFDALAIGYANTAHPPVYTVEESAHLTAQMPGAHSKNLFLQDKKGALFLLCALGDRLIDLNAVSKLIGAGRFSFGNAELLMRCLGVSPGSVTLFALINDPERQVTLLLDEGFFAHRLVNFHPLRNDATTAITPADMLRFLDSLRRTPIRLVFDPAGKPSLIEPGAASAHVSA